jgi:hypothetical protein
MVATLTALLLASTPVSPSTVKASSLFFAAGEGLGAMGSQPWIGQALTAGTVSPLFSRFGLDVTDVPVLGPATAVLLDLQLQHDGWSSRALMNFTSFGLQTVGAALAVSELFDEDVDEGAVDTLRPTRVSFRLLEGGGEVTVSGVTF